MKDKLGRKIRFSLKKGDKFNHLTVISFNRKLQKWHCKCDCGKFTNVGGYYLKHNLHKTCGCGRKLPRKRLENNVALKLRLFRGCVASAKKRNIQFSISKEDFIKIITNECHYCGGFSFPPRKDMINYDLTFKYNGLDRVDNEKGYTIRNVVPCCKMCNFSKSTLTINEFKNWIKRIYDRQFNK